MGSRHRLLRIVRERDRALRATAWDGNPSHAYVELEKTRKRKLDVIASVRPLTRTMRNGPSYRLIQECFAFLAEHWGGRRSSQYCVLGPCACGAAEPRERGRGHSTVYCAPGTAYQQNRREREGKRKRPRPRWLGNTAQPPNPANFSQDRFAGPLRGHTFFQNATPTHNNSPP